MEKYAGQFTPWNPNVLTFNPVEEAEALGAYGRFAYGIAVKWPAAVSIARTAIMRARK